LLKYYLRTDLRFFLTRFRIFRAVGQTNRNNTQRQVHSSLLYDMN